MKNRISKKLVSMGLVGTLLFAGAMPAMAIDQSFEVKNAIEQTSYSFSYEINEDNTGVTITDLPENYSGWLIIPSTIKSLPVTSIGISAFENCTNLKTITIPDSVMNIDTFAFYGCTSLTSIQTNSVKTIGCYAFSRCTNLASITLGNSLTTINDYAFDGCTSLTEINIPNSITAIGQNTFSNCEGLTNIIIPNSVKSIGWAAFFNCTNLSSITISNSVTSIDGWAFSGCTSLKSVTIPDSVTILGDCVFADCTSLTSIKIPNSLKSFGGATFENTAWYNAQPNGAVYFDNWLVDYKGTMPENTNLAIKDGTLGIATFAFDSCTGLTNITFPDSLISIGGATFDSCTNLTEVTLPNSLKTIGGAAFNNCTGLISVTIPNSVTSLEWGTFAYCENLKTVTIPNSVKIIDDYAFDSCENITIDCCEGSYAQTFAENNNIPYQIIASESTVYAMKTNSTYYYKNGEVKPTYESNIDGNNYKAQLQFNNSKTFLPIRSVAEAIGLDVGYDIMTGLSTVSNGTKTVKIIPDSTNIIVVENGVENVVNIGVAPLYVGGFIHVPVRAVIQEFGFDVNWHFEGYLLITDYELSSSEINELKAKVEKLL